MNCRFEEDVTAYVDGELAADRRAEFEAHLEGCGGCRTLVALFRATFARVAALPDVEPSPALRRAVLARIAEQAPWPLRLAALLRRPPVWLGAAAAASVAVGAVVYFRADGARDLLPADAPVLALAAQLDEVEELDVVGLENPEDLDVVASLDELGPPKEGLP